MLANEASEERRIDQTNGRFEDFHALEFRLRDVAAGAVRQLQHDGERAARLQPFRNLLDRRGRIDVLEKERRMDEIDRRGLELERSEVRADELESGDILRVPLPAYFKILRIDIEPDEPPDAAALDAFEPVSRRASEEKQRLRLELAA